MKKLLFALLVGITSLAYSQVPQGINYQSVVRSTSGAILPSTAITVEFKLYDGLSTTLVYHETHSTTTNSFGMANLIIGQGTPLSGSFNSIPWSTTNGIGYEVLVNSNLVGSKQLFMSVPYALHAGSAPAPAVSFTNNILSVGGNTTSITSGTTYTAGNGISISGNTLTNTAPDQTVTITPAGSASVTGTYPNFTISTPTTQVYTAGNGIDISAAGVISNTLTPVTPTLSVTGNSISINPGNTQALPNYSLTQSGANIDLTQNGTSIATVTLTAATSTSLSAGSPNIVLNQSGNAYTITPVTPTFTNSGPTTISGSFPNYTVNSVASPSTTLVQGNNVILNNSGSTYTVSSAPYSLSSNSNTLTLTNGTVVSTATVPASSSYSGTPNNISITSNSINLIPTGVTAGVYGANATNAVPTYSVDNFGRLISSGQYTTTLSGDVLGAANTTTVTKLQTRPVSNTAPTANQVLTWNGSAWTPSSTVVPILSYTGSATSGTLQSGAQTVTIPNYTLSNTSNTITLNNGTANSTAIIPVPTLTLSGGSILQSGPATNTVNLSGLGGIYSGSGSVQTGSTTVTIGTNTLTFLSGATLGKSIANFFGGGITGTHLAVGHTGANASAIKLFGSVSTAPVDYGYISGSSNGIAISGGTSTNGLYATNTAEIGVGTYTTGAGKFVVTHAATQANPTMHLRETSGALSRIKFSNTGVLNRFFEAGASVNAADNFSAYSISFHDGTNYKSRFLIYGDGKTSINNMHTALTTFHVMDDNATSPGIATEGFGFSGQMNLTRNNPLGVSPTYTRGAVFGGQEIGKINFAAHDGTNYGDGAKIYARTTENVTTGTRGTELIFAAVPTGTNTNKDAFKINGLGNLEVISGLRIPVGAVSGNVLTSDAAGNASWQPITTPAAAWTSTLGNTYLVNSGDKVGIGTNTPNSPFQVLNYVSFENNGSNTSLGYQTGVGVSPNNYYNTMVGASAGQAVGTGSSFANTFMGYQSGLSNSNGNSNTFVGSEAGKANTANNNTYLGANAGRLSTSGNANVFLGANSGAVNTVGTSNVFLGFDAGKSNTTGGDNTFVGRNSGPANTTGSSNIFIGSSTANLNTAGSFNVFLGNSAGNNTTNGNSNVFIGYQTGINNTTGQSNTFIGRGADLFSATQYTNATAIGYNSRVDASDALVLGNSNTKVGIGTSQPSSQLHVVNNSGSQIKIGNNNQPALEWFWDVDATSNLFLKNEGNGTTQTKLYFDYNSGNLGLGAGAPGYKLTVIGGANDDLATIYAVNNATSTTSASHGVQGLTFSTYSLSAGIFGNNNSVGPSVYGVKNGTQSGIAGRFEILNTANTADGVFVSTSGRGAAIHAVNGPTVTGSSNVALLLEDGHMKSVGTTPTYTLNALAIGTGVIGTDMVGKLSFTNITSPLIGNTTDVISVKYDKPYSTTPNVIVIPNNSASFGVNAYVFSSTVNGFTLRFSNNGTLATTYSFNYLVIE